MKTGANFLLVTFIHSKNYINTPKSSCFYFFVIRKLPIGTLLNDQNLSTGYIYYVKL